MKFSSQLPSLQSSLGCISTHMPIGSSSIHVHFMGTVTSNTFICKTINLFKINGIIRKFKYHNSMGKDLCGKVAYSRFHQKSILVTLASLATRPLPVAILQAQNWAGKKTGL